MGFVQRLIGHLLLVVDTRKWVCSIFEEEDDLVERYETLQRELERERASNGTTSNGSDATPESSSVVSSDPPQQQVENDWPPAPFVRNDEYGVCGWHGPKLTALEWIRVVVQGIAVAGIVSAFAVCLVTSTILWRSPQKANRVWSRWLPLWTHHCLQLIGFEPLKIRLVHHDADGNILKVVETTTTDTPVVEPSAPVLVCNHVSYLDVPVLYRVLLPSFIAKESVQELPIWGRLAQVMKVTYVSHGSTTPKTASTSTSTTTTTTTTTSTTDQLIAQIRHIEAVRGTASQRPSIVIFPEGTTTNGSYLLPFKTGVFRANTPVQPILLEYQWNRFNVSWETIGLVRHLVYLLAQPAHCCTLTIGTPVEPPSPEELHRLMLTHKEDDYNSVAGVAKEALVQKIAAKHFADKTRRIMSKIGSMPCSEFTYREKKKYHDELRASGYS